MNVKDRLQALEQQIRLLNTFLTDSDSVFRVLSDTLKAHRANVLREVQNGPMNAILTKVRTDPELRFPHRKILEFLASRYDFTTNAFQEAFFSQIVRGARLGKNRAREYLAVLERKGYIQSRHDGYRLFFRIVAG